MKSELADEHSLVVKSAAKPLALLNSDIFLQGSVDVCIVCDSISIRMF